VGTVFSNDLLETRLELVQAQRGRHSGSLGVQYLDRDLDAVGAEAFIPATTTERWALFTLQEIAVGQLRWQLGGRFESQDVTPTGQTARSHDGLSASAGLVWDATESFAVAASVSRAVKMPAPEELFSNGLHVATQSFEVGDPNLVEEVGTGADLSLRLEAGRVSGELTVFRQEFSDFIFQAFTGDEEDGFPVVQYSQRDATFTGAELRGRFELLDRDDHHVHLSVLADTVDAELEAGGNLPRIPPARFGGGLHYHGASWNASAEAQRVEDQDEVSENETPTSGYTLVHASLGYRLFLGNTVVDLLLRGRNLTDEEARVHTSFLKDVAPLPGRNVTLGIKLVF
jgi:iron complex outermembrane receptor protein